MSNPNHSSSQGTSSPRRFGEMLSAMVPLSAHDIDEILCEQNVTRRRFGDIALSLGLCRPEHVLEALFAQLASSTTLPQVNLEALGVDVQAVSLSNAEVAERLHVIPVRLFNDVVLVAIASDTSDEERQTTSRDVAAHLRREVRFVTADRTEIRNAIAKYYAS